MSTTAPTLAQVLPPMNLIDRVVTCVAWGVGAAAFLTIGWVAMHPDDPLGPVSLMARSGSGLMLVQAAALAAVAAGIATVLAGRKLAEAGVFAACLGLTAVSLRGGTIGAMLVVRQTGASSTSHQGLAVAMLGEALAWTLVVVVAMLVSAVVDRVCFGAHGSTEPTSDDDLRVVAARSLAVTDIPVLSELVTGMTPSRRTPWKDGLRHAAITVALAMMLMSFISSGLAARSTQHGQMCFLVAGPMLLAAYGAHHMAPVRTPLWGLLAVPLLALVALVAAMLLGGHSEIASLPPSAFLRILPIQYISVGAASVVLMFWYMYVPGTETSRAPAEPPSARGPVRKGGR